MGKVKKEDMRISQEEYDRIRRENPGEFICRNCGSVIRFEDVSVAESFNKAQLLNALEMEDSSELLETEYSYTRVANAKCSYPTLGKEDALILGGYIELDGVVDVLEEEG